MRYVYVYTGDRKKEDRLNRINRAIENLDDKDVIFVVNDLQSIAYLKENGFKALNVDAIDDLFNLLTPDDEIILCTPEDTLIVKASFANAKEICNE